MTKKILIESHRHQTRVAILEDGQLAELFFERERERGLVGNIYRGRVTRIIPGMQAAFVSIGLERDAFLYVGDVENGPRTMPEDDSTPPPLPAIEEVLRRGQELTVQVIKDPLPNKGARISTQITLPGRYLVLLPGVHQCSVSRRIEDEDERQRLLDLVQELVPAEQGLIVRTVGEGREREAFAEDLVYLVELWEQIRARAGRVSAPTLVHQDLDLSVRVARDLFSEEVAELHVEGETPHQRVKEFIETVQPSLATRLRLETEPGALFRRFSIDEEIESALRSKVWLRSGGHIVIHPTEALVAIDVNTGRFTGGQDLEETVLKTNLEAIREVVRQIRLRDLGGIIVLDLIDMVEEEHRDQVFTALEEELRKDRAKNKVLRISEFGLVELTRKRSRPSLARRLTQACPYCRGRGRVKSTSTVCLELRRTVIERNAQWQSEEVVARVHPEVARALQQEEKTVLDELRECFGVSVLVQSDSELHQEKFELDGL